MLIDADALNNYLTELRNTFEDSMQPAGEKARLQYAGAIRVIDILRAKVPEFVSATPLIAEAEEERIRTEAKEEAKAELLSGASPHNVRRNDPETALVASSNAMGHSKNRERVLQAALALGEGTPREIAAKAIEMFPGVYPPYSLERRVTDLKERGLIEWTGEKRNGSKVWKVVGVR